MIRNFIALVLAVFALNAYAAQPQPAKANAGRHSVSANVRL